MKLPVVVIVGRPNVGKSTLFNRLVGRREAIVDDLSGVTRDRNYGEVEWNAKLFRLIDTGGYVPESKDLFEKEIREQVRMGIDEADFILFVVDAREGLTPVDEEIAKLLRASGKKCLVVVNKVDSSVQEQLMHDFHGLGLGELHPVSATVGRGTGDFLDILTKDFPERNQYTEDSRLKIAIVGRPNVGKSSLTNALLGFDRSVVTDIPGTTRDSVDSILKFHGEEIVLIDTAGLRKRTKVKENIEFYSGIRTLKAIDECNVSIVMIDASIGLESQDQKIIDEAVKRRKGIILAVNKWDLIEKDSKTADDWAKALRKKLGMLEYIPVIFISALQKQRIYKLIELAKEIQSRRIRKIPTAELNDTILPEIELIPPPSGPTGKEIKIKYVTMGGEYYPIFLFFSNQPKYIPEHYKRYLENCIRKHYDYTGIPITLAFKQK